jgi:anti-sigma regulatory factor (Ser/Thr protein kinase)
LALAGVFVLPPELLTAQRRPNEKWSDYWRVWRRRLRVAETNECSRVRDEREHSMCRVRTVDYLPAAEHVPQARHWLQGLLRRWELEGLIPDASLLITELVTNAVVHAQTPVHVTAAVADGVLEIGVADHDSHSPHVTHPNSQAETGRGVALVDDIADDWGVVTLKEGKQIWFQLSIDSAWSHRTACPCAGSNLDRVRLESGRFALAVNGPWDD